MVPSYGIVIYAILLVGGLWWCKEIIGRLPQDIEEFRTSDNTAEKGVIVFYWALTVVIILLIAFFLWGLIASILSAFR